jgi:aminoglycoside phosphotransferase (APT) family kinase protein/dephospho-CoA kinase
MIKIILITGASGSGKTFVSKYLAEQYQVFNFDDIGVPTIDTMIREYGGAEQWQEWATRKWIEKLLAVKDQEIVILEGSFNPDFAVEFFKEKNFDNYKIICLHSTREVREKRLTQNRKQPDLATQDMENFTNILREKTLACGGVVIDSSGDIYDTVEKCLEEIGGVASLRREVPKEIAINLVKEQFPQWSYLEIRPVKYGGWDNATFHLGEEMLLRIPRGEGYALKVPKEHVLLKKLRPNFSVEIPQPIAMGNPSKEYQWNWSIYQYLEGDSANSIKLSDKELENIAYDLGKFLNELHKIDTKDASLPGLHNGWRGEHVSVYECGALNYFNQLKDIIDYDKVLSLWKKAVATKWQEPPVWIHGDLSSGNILIKDGRLSAVIDFGGCGIGDPACDLVIAWTLFQGKSRDIFRDQVNLDENTWNRAKAWALWKAGYELVNIEDKLSQRALEQLSIINEVVGE